MLVVAVGPRPWSALWVAPRRTRTGSLDRSNGAFKPDHVILTPARRRPQRTPGREASTMITDQRSAAGVKR